jgi:hypothetical protein
MLRRAALVRTDVSEKLSASFIGVTRIGELGTARHVLYYRAQKIALRIQIAYTWPY